MAYDFPANPTEGQVFTPPVGGQSYIFVSPRWLVQGIPPASSAGPPGPAGPTGPTGPTGPAGANGSPDTAAQVLAKLITVDGTGSGLDADRLDGYDSIDFANMINTKLDITAYNAADVLTKIKTVDGTGSGLDADLLDGQSGAYYLDNANSTGTLPAGSFNDTTHGDRAGGTLHPAVTTSVNGFMSAADKVTFNAIPTTYAPIASPTFTGDPKAPTPTAGDNDTSIATTAFVAAALTAGGVGTAQARNRIVNGAMQVSQENGNTAQGPITAVTWYAADQWYISSSTSPGTATVQRVQSVTPSGSKYRIRVTIGTAKATLVTTDIISIQQNIEGIRVADFRYGTAQAKQAVLRFGWKSPAGTYSMWLTNSATNRSYVGLFTISAGEANTDVERTLVIPGDTTGTWLTDTGKGMELRAIIGTGPTYQGVAGWQAGLFVGTSANTNGMATAGAVYELFDVGLYLDHPLATGVAPRWEMPDEAQELAACQRYWYRSFDGALFLSSYTAPSAAHVGYQHPVPMRIASAVTESGGGQLLMPGPPSSLGGAAPDGFWCYRMGTAAGMAYYYATVTANARM